MLGCPVSDEQLILVKVANGHKLISSQTATNFSWSVQGHEFTYSLRLLRNEGYDIILGSDWLEYCTPIILDYKKMTCTVHVGRKKIKMQAVTKSNECQLISGPSLHSLTHKHMDEVEEIYLITPHFSDFNVNLDLQPLLEEFHDVFDEPQGLPPVLDLPEVDADGLCKIEPFLVLEKRIMNRNGDDILQYLIQWLNLGPEHATWEDAAHIHRKFPSFRPCGQGSSSAGGIVTIAELSITDERNESMVNIVAEELRLLLKIGDFEKREDKPNTLTESNKEEVPAVPRG